MHIITVPSPVVTQAVAASGADSVLIDLEHGAVDYGTAHAMIAATQGTGCAPLVRVSEIREAEVKRVLDLGAEGICFPLVRTAEDARRAVASLRYPPEGTRGFGPFIAQSRWGTDMPGYRPKVADEIVSCLLVETRDAVENIEEICAVPGIDMLVPAQFDLSTDLGVPGQFDHPDFVSAVSRVRAAAARAGIPTGQIALTAEQAAKNFAEGYRVIAGVDAIWLRAAAAAAQSWCA
ncbi:2,4-dihydroxyhept-2-ene-1,7-dioic acid aldolase [Rhodobacterales bacterium HKCCE3408]|nr:2,4-dihydroxyhept-2-ene-1,7-dioic acid aldolase [Rhodobacterales bacterium HKCCE3408]